MKRNILAMTVLIAIAGLTFVQFRLLVIGARLEKQRFDQRALVAQRNIRQSLNEPNPLSDALVDYLKKEDHEESGPLPLADSLQEFVQEKFAEVGITAQLSFAIVQRHSLNEVAFKSNSFKPDRFTFGEYVIPLGDYFSKQLYREEVMHIDVENLFAYLLSELDYLVIPSVLCLFAILLCLFFLINILKKEQKLNTIKNDFINNLTHELKTPAFSIALSGKLAKENLAAGNLDKVAEFLEIVEQENGKIKLHTEKVLELASLENSKKQLQLEKCNLHELISAAVEAYLPKVKQRSGQLDFLPGADRYEALVDRVHFENILSNLLNNSLNYCERKPSIEIGTSNEGRYFILSVKDNGIGISAEDQKFVFDKFFRAGSGNLHRVKGFGLGLSYVKQVVEAHRGKILLTSRKGEGTLVRVYLPL